MKSVQSQTVLTVSPSQELFVGIKNEDREDSPTGYDMTDDPSLGLEELAVNLSSQFNFDSAAKMKTKTPLGRPPVAPSSKHEKTDNNVKSTHRTPQSKSESHPGPLLLHSPGLSPIHHTTFSTNLRHETPATPHDSPIHTPVHSLDSKFREQLTSDDNGALGGELPESEYLSTSNLVHLRSFDWSLDNSIVDDRHPVNTSPFVVNSDRPLYTISEDPNGTPVLIPVTLHPHTPLQSQILRGKSKISPSPLQSSSLKHSRRAHSEADFNRDQFDRNQFATDFNHELSNNSGRREQSNHSGGGRKDTNYKNLDSGIARDMYSYKSPSPMRFTSKYWKDRLMKRSLTSILGSPTMSNFD